MSNQAANPTNPFFPNEPVSMDAAELKFLKTGLEKLLASGSSCSECLWLENGIRSLLQTAEYLKKSEPFLSLTRETWKEGMENG